MAERWCGDCEKRVEAVPVSWIPAVAVIFAMLFFVIVPFLGTVIGVPALIITFGWLILTPKKCRECDGRSLKKIVN